MIHFILPSKQSDAKKAVRLLLSVLPTSCMLFLFSLPSYGQLVEDLIVETYYITDENDAASASADGIPAGAVTYRLLLDICEGCRLTQIYATDDHELRIESTESFFNASIGAAYGHGLNGALFPIFDAAPLDSYLSFGAASTVHWGRSKSADTDGSIWAERVAPAALTNNSPELGLPLTESDGLISSGGQSTTPTGWILPSNNQEVLAAFGNGADTSIFASQNILLQSSAGVFGQNSENAILIAQITTLGALSFEINVEILDSLGERHNVVAANATGEELLSPFLSFPRECGCTDSDFLEYDPIALCDDGSCSTFIVFGCLNEEACNYDETANFNVPELCCFVDSCQGLDPSIICPTLNTSSQNVSEVILYPNPTSDFVFISGLNLSRNGSYLHLVDANGRVIRDRNSVESRSDVHFFDVRNLQSGLYFVIYQDHNTVGAKKLQVVR